MGECFTNLMHGGGADRRPIAPAGIQGDLRRIDVRDDEAGVIGAARVHGHEERRHIAAVFENRLRLGMKLQSDPTIIYGITKGYPIGRRIRQSEIDAQTPYNTYAIPGLPVGPICNPGKDSIAAVLNPDETDDLFFVASGSGGHVFSDTMAAHLRNVAAYRAQERHNDQPERQVGESPKVAQPAIALPDAAATPKLPGVKRAPATRRRH